MPKDPNNVAAFTQGLDKLTSSLNQLSFQRNLDNANEQVQTIKNSELNASKQRAALNQVSSELVNQMYRIGVNFQQAQAIGRTFAPPRPPQNIEQALLDPSTAELGQRALEAKSRADLGAFEIKERIKGREKIRVAGETVKPTPKRPLGESAIKTLDGLRSSLNSFDKLEAITTSGKFGLNITNPAFSNQTVKSIWGKTNPDFSKFNQIVTKLFASYLKMMSGVAAAEKEVIRLKAFIPTGEETPKVFKAKLQQADELIRDELKIWISNRKIAGFEVSGFEALQNKLGGLSGGRRGLIKSAPDTQTTSQPSTQQLPPLSFAEDL